jgi:hypothetical protein
MGASAKVRSTQRVLRKGAAGFCEAPEACERGVLQAPNSTIMLSVKLKDKI